MFSILWVENLLGAHTAAALHQKANGREQERKKRKYQRHTLFTFLYVSETSAVYKCSSRTRNGFGYGRRSWNLPAILMTLFEFVWLFMFFPCIVFFWSKSASAFFHSNIFVELNLVIYFKTTEWKFCVWNFLHWMVSLLISIKLFISHVEIIQIVSLIQWFIQTNTYTKNNKQSRIQ